MKGRSGGGLRGGWEALREYVFKRSRGQCECEGECGTDHQGRCPFKSIPFRYRDPVRRNVRWISELEVAHKDHDLQHNATWNLQAMCRPCHVAYDRRTHPRYNRSGMTEEN